MGTPGAGTVKALTTIWEKALGRSPIDPEENFFDLCSDDAVVDSIFSAITSEFGRVLPSAAICYAPTIAELAALIAQPALAAFSSFVKLKAGDGNAPLFILPGLGGRSSFSELANCIDTERSVYGIQARGVDGRETPFDRVEEMAEFYLGGLREMQPVGPYFLMGYSFGGLLALEMAQRIVSSGGKVALLTFLDTYPDRRYMAMGQRLRLSAKRLRGKVFGEKETPVERGDTAKREVGGSRFSFAATMQRVKESDLRAIAYYQPSFYNGTVRFVKPETTSFVPSDPAAVWKKFVKTFEVETVPGDHVGMVAKHFKSLGAALSRHIREASEGPS